MEDNNQYTYQNATYHNAPGGKRSSSGAKTGLWIGLGIVLVLAIMILGGCFVITYPDEYKVVKQFGEIHHVVDEPGLSFKAPFIQTAETLPKQTLLYDIPATDVITKDKKSMVADAYVLWKIEDATKYVRFTNSSMNTAVNAINSEVYNAMKTVISSMNQDEVISSRTNDDENDDVNENVLSSKVLRNISSTSKLADYGIAMVDVVVKRLDLPDDNKNAAYERMIEERNAVAADEKSDGEKEAQMIRTKTDKMVTEALSEAEAEAAKTIAEGEAEYMRILSNAYNDPDKADFYIFVLSLDAARASYANGNKTLVLTKDSPLAQVFMNAE